MATLPITAFVASRNEGHLLDRCLSSISFCNELIVIDIDSDDETGEIAEAHGARVARTPWVPIAEHARLELVNEARHEWLLFLDPDEEFAPALARQVAERISSLASDIAIVECPWQFYFRGKRLRGTIWGGTTRKRTLVRKGTADLYRTVHSGTRLRTGYRVEHIPFTGDNAIAHYWATGYLPLIEKHWRYLKLEGRDRRSQGMVTGYRDIARTPLPAFWESFVKRKGYRDGLTGLLLSILWSTYATGAKIALLAELRRHGRLSAAGSQ